MLGILKISIIDLASIIADFLNLLQKLRIGNWLILKFSSPEKELIKEKERSKQKRVENISNTS